MKLKNFIIIILSIIIISCSNNEQKKEGTYKMTDEQKKTVDELLDVNPNEKLVAEFVTNKGNFSAELYAKLTPMTIKNFVTLAVTGYYNNVTFHRVIKDFMIQTGDPTATGSGGESIYGGEFKDEFDANLIHDTPGVLSMANRGPNTNTSQFFITLVPTPWLNAKHTVFGKVISGIDIIEQIGDAKTNGMDKPLSEIKIEKINLTKK
ncbi:MAG: peptidylprolyl isomerase [Melioribacteraceae bacterium]|nr:peptidylprolyl isomerase [Melioribacteraceae bacterium]